MSRSASSTTNSQGGLSGEHIQSSRSSIPSCAEGRWGDRQTPFGCPAFSTEPVRETRHVSPPSDLDGGVWLLRSARHESDVRHLVFIVHQQHRGIAFG